MFGFHVEERCPEPLSCRVTNCYCSSLYGNGCNSNTTCASHQDVLLMFHVVFYSLRFGNYAIRRAIEVPGGLIVDFRTVLESGFETEKLGLTFQYLSPWQ